MFMRAGLKETTGPCRESLSPQIGSHLKPQELQTQGLEVQSYPWLPSEPRAT